MCRGASVIVDPFGEVLAGPLLDQEGLLVADLDLDDVTRGRYDFDASATTAAPTSSPFCRPRQQTVGDGRLSIPKQVSRASRSRVP